MADAATEAGAEIRTGASVARVMVRDGRAAGVVLDDGREIERARGHLERRSEAHASSGSSIPSSSIPSFLVRIRNYRCPGTTAKVNLALSALPAFRGVEQPSRLRGRRCRSDRASTTSNAPSTRRSTARSRPQPYLDITIPTLHDPSLAPAGAHVMSIYVQFAPYTLAGGRSWSDAADDLGRTVFANAGAAMRRASSSSSSISR